MFKYCFLFLSILSFSTAFSQSEICNDGIDNDKNGFIDCFDGSCANNAACTDFYIGKDKACQDPPAGTLLFQMQLTDTSVVRTTLTYGRFVVGDLDRDGEPEVVTTHRNDKKVYILKGSDFSIKKQWTTEDPIEYYDHAIANLDNDNCAEIFIVEEDNGFYITSYDCNGTKLWRTKAYGRPFDLGLADFDHDGKVELYYKNEILDAHTGIVLVEGTGTWSELDSGPVAADMLADDYTSCDHCEGLELVAGGKIYAVDLDPRTEKANTLELALDINDQISSADYFPKYSSFGYVTSQTSIADFNLDGSLDVIMSGAYSASTTSPVAVFFWDVKNGTVQRYGPRQSTKDKTGWSHGTGRLNVADIDGDGKMNVMFVSGKRLFALKEDFTLKWYKPINEGTSGFTSTTVFDFNNDNAVEIVYRDEQNLYIIDGKTGNDFTSEVCRSRTANDYPVVVDVDGDGATEICVTCNNDDGADINNNDNTVYGQLRKYESALEPWVSARKVWNQHGYFNVNVNDDLTIPKFQQKHHVVFSEDKCKDFEGDTIFGENRALNSFLNQAPILDSKGCKTYAAADVRFKANPEYLNVDAPTCPDQNFKVTFTIENNGDLALTGDLYVTFYAGDPRVAGATKLETVIVPLEDFGYQDEVTVSDTIVGTGGNFTLFAALNDKGEDAPPISLPNGGFNECDPTNNIESADIRPKPFALTTASTPHIECGGVTAIPNGSAEAYRSVNGAKQTVGYSFYWFNGSQAGSNDTAAYVGSVRSGLNDGSYSVYALHTAFQCSSDTVSVEVDEDAKQLATPSIVVVSDFTNCNVPDGELHVVPANGEPVGNFEYEWYLATEPLSGDLLSTTDKLAGFEAESYVVFVTEKATGCQSQAPGKIEDKTDFEFTVTATSVAAGCQPPNSGIAIAQVLTGAGTPVPDDNAFNYAWYDGDQVKPSLDRASQKYEHAEAGEYTIVAISKANGCATDPFTVTVESTTLDPIDVQVTNQTACVGSNGSAVIDAVPGLTYEWFKGKNTGAGNLIGTGTSRNDLSAGDYTIRATQTSSNCTVKTEIKIADDIKYPTITTLTDGIQTACSPANGILNVSNAGTATGPFDYYWFDGDIGTPDTTANDFKGQQYAGLEAGEYTVVAVDRLTRCASARQVGEVIDNTTAITMPAPTITPQTSCDAASPNGAASINVTTPAGTYSYQWFAGTDTTATPVATANSATQLSAISYTVKAINNTTGCSNTRVVPIPDQKAKPVLAFTKVDNSICDNTLGFDGSISTSFSSNPNGLNSHTYVYEWQRAGVVIAGETGSSISGIDDGSYTVSVTNQTLKCTSDPVNVVVNDVANYPDLVLNSTASTNCTVPAVAPVVADGTAFVVSIDGDPANDTDFDFSWTGPAGLFDVSGNPTNDDITLTGVQGGTGYNYSVVVTNVSNGCETTQAINVADGKVLPIVSLVPTNNTICSPATSFNGKITATITNQVGALSNYTFAFGGGAGSGNAVGNEYRNLNGSTTPYTATATNTLTGCISSQVTTLVNNNQNTPDLTTSMSGSTNCVAGKEDGEARVVTVDGAAATTTGFTYLWVGPASFDVSANATNNDIELSGVQGGTGYTYTVYVTNTSNGCIDSAKVNVADSKVLPIVSLAPTDNTICSPATSFNGKITATITNQIGAITDYTFAFGGGAGSGTTVGNEYTILNGSTIPYTAIATHTPTGCASSQVTTLVDNDQNKPDLTTSMSGSTNCVAGKEDGEARVVTVDGAAATTTGFTYLWVGPASFDVSANATNDDIELSGVQGGTGYTYTVYVTNTSNGCIDSAKVDVADSKVLPIVSLVPTDNTICSPATSFNGKITATITNQVGAITNYTFAFGGGAGSGTTVGNEYTILNGSTTPYTAVATHTPTGCVSSQVTTLVDNDQNTPDLTTSMSGSTNCVAGKEDGEARVVTVDGAAATTTGFTYLWVGPASFDVSANPTNDDIELSGVQGGTGYTYTVYVTNTSNGCIDSAKVNVADSKVLPIVALTPTDNTMCSPATSFNGKITAAITNQIGAISNYTFAFGGGAGSGTAVGNEYTILNGSATPYTATATHTPTGCQSSQVTALVNNNQNFPDLTTSMSGSTNCVATKENGKARVVTVDGAAATTTGFTYGWVGPAAFSVAANPTRNSIELTGLQGGTGYDYTVTVTNTSNGCTNTAVVNVADSKILPLLSLTTTPNSICNPAEVTVGIAAYDGTISASITNIPGGSTANDYVFDWSVGTDGAGLNTSTRLDSGSYTVQVEHTPTGCESSVYNAQVLSSRVLPTITTQSTASHNCAGGAADGIAAVTGITPALKTYSYEWYDGSVATGTIKDSDATYAGIQGGVANGSAFEYTVKVIIRETGCENTATVGVLDDSQLPDLGNITTTDNTICSSTIAKDGTATLTSLTYRGSAVPTTSYGNFTFTWSAGTPITSPHVQGGLGSGSYTLVVTNIDDNCSSSPETFTVDDNFYFPVIDIAETPQTSCDDNNPNGKLEATVNENVAGGPGGGVSITAGYTFVWKNHGNPFGAVVTPDPNPFNTNGIDQLASDKYYQVTVTRTATGCSNTKAYLLTSDVTYPTVALTALQAQTECTTPNASARADVTIAAVEETLTYYWLKEANSTTTTTDSATVIAGVLGNSTVYNRLDDNETAITNTQNNLVSGRYTVVVRDDYNKCVSQPVSVDIVDQTASTVTIDIGALPSTCFANGALEMRASRVSAPVATDFDFEIYRGGPVNTVVPIDYYSTPANPPIFNATVIQVLNNIANNTDVVSTAAGINSDLYTVVATDNFGCKSHETFFLPFQDAHGIDELITDVTDCTVDNGSIAMRAIFPTSGPGIANNQSDYTFTFYAGGVPLAANEVDAIVGGSTFTNPFGAETNPSSTWPSTPANLEECNSPAVDNDGDGKLDAADEDCNGRITASNLPPGFYYLRVEDKLSTCSVYESIEIKQTARPAVINVTAIKGNTACDLTQADGSIELNITKDPADTAPATTYTLDVNPDPSAYPVALTLGTTHTITGLDPSSSVPTYTLTVESANHCISTKTIAVPNTPLTAELLSTDVTITDAEYCDPALEQTAKVVVDNVRLSTGVVEAKSDYRFDWYGDSSLSPALYSANGDVAANTGGDEFSNDATSAGAGIVTFGDYYVTVTKINDTGNTGGEGCTSGPLKVEIEDNTVDPVIVLRGFKDTSCDTTVFEGSIRVRATTASGPGSAGLYSYTWTPTGAAGQPALRTGQNGNFNTYLSINDGSYNAVIENETTGCSTNASTTVPVGTPPLFTLTANTVPLTNCDPASFDGAVNTLVIAIDGAGGDETQFDYIWYKDLPTGTLVLDGTAPDDTQLTLTTYPAITAGTYYVKAQRMAGSPGRGCFSSAFRQEILDQRVYPQVALSSVGSTACNTNYDGQITVTASTTSGPGSGAAYDFEWTSDPDNAGTAFSVADAPNTTSPYTTLGTDRVGEGAYAITVTNVVTSCASNASITVQRNTVPVVITKTEADSLTHCTVADGEAQVTEVTVNGGSEGLGNFSYAWSNSASGALIGGLSDGTYAVTATKTSTTSPGSGCVSAPVQVKVDDARKYPVLSFATTASTACNVAEADGGITVTASTQNYTATQQYNYTWTSQPGTATIASRTNLTSPQTFLSQAIGGDPGQRISPGAYAITVRNNANTCTTNGSVTVVENRVPVIITKTASDSLTHCTTPNGEAQVTEVTVDGSSEPLTNFAYAWSNAGASDLISALSNGTYTVTATKTATSSPASGCASAPVNVDVDDERKYPVLSFAATASTACNVTQADGGITVTATTENYDPATQQYNFTWTSEPATASIADRTNSVSPQNFLSEAIGGAFGQRISAGAYAITVRNNGNECTTNGVVSVVENRVPVVITRTGSDSLTHCTTPDGEAQVIEVTVDGSGELLTNFSYAWSNGGTTDLIAALSNGTYSVTATKTAVSTPASGCVSAPVDVEVDDARKYPVVSFSTTASTACNVAQADGGIIVTATTENYDPASQQYNFTWTSEPATASIADRSNSISPQNFFSEATGGAVGQRISAGAYSIIVRNNANECTTNGSVTVIENRLPVVITRTESDSLTHCTTPDGHAQVTEVTVDGSSEALGNFDYSWSNGGTTAMITALSNGTYSVTATKTAVSTPASGCVSAPVAVQVDDARQYPVLSFATTASTACDVTQADAGITVTASTQNYTGTQPYHFTWTSEPATANIADRLAVASPQNFLSEAIGGAAGQRISSGDYTITVQNVANMCTTDGSITVIENRVPIVIAQTNADSLTHCTIPNGAVEVTEVTVDGGLEPLTNFAYVWSTGGTTVGLTGLGLGTVNVVATKTSLTSPGSGCQSAPVNVTVEDARRYPAISFTTVANTSCDINEFDGAITVLTSTETFNAATTYNFNWNTTPGGTVVISNGSGLTSPYVRQSEALGGPVNENIGAGNYEVLVTNNVNGCQSTASVTVLDNRPTISILDVVEIDQQDCTPFDGGISVDETNAAHMSLPGVYSYVWTRGGTDITQAPDHILTGINAGTYEVIATKGDRPGLACVTSPYVTEIKDLTITPTVELSSIGNIACDPAIGTGSISMLIDGSADQTNYVVAWQNSGGNPVATLTNIRQDVYSVSVTDNLSPNLGCFTLADITVPFDTTVLSLELASTPQVNCAPSQDGSVTVLRINETVRMATTTHEVSTNTTHRANFDYQWFDDTMANITPVLDGATATNPHILGDRFAGEYLVQVTNVLGCVSFASAKIVEDETATPDVSLFSFQNPRVCTVEKFGEGKGEMFVMVDGGNNFGDYTLEWFTPDTTGTVVSTQPFINDIDFNEPLTYTLRTTNNATNCFALDEYTFDPDTLDIRVSASSLPITSCISDDGILFGAVAEGVSAGYDYEWYEGATATGTIMATSQEVLNVSEGTYTVIARHPTQTFCVSVPSTVELLTDQRFPVVETLQKNPLTYCYPDLFDGVASASVDGSVIRHTFNWFEGSSTTSFYTGSEVSGLNAITYTVVASDNITGCAGEAQITIERNHPQIPKPEVTVLAHQTNCVLNNGELQASIDGHLNDYIISWYNGGQVKTLADAEGEFYDSLDNGLYTTTAMEKVTGCVSDPVISEILEFLDYPEFHIVVNPTSCEDPIGEILLKQTNNVPIAQVDWLYHPYDSTEAMMSPYIRTEGDSVEGVMLGGLDKGWYKAQITTAEGCYMEELMQVIPEILVFNAVSINGDNAHEIFEIACISDFPNNVVKIFNRAGTLVYEAAGYDNEGVVFTGVSNKGFSILGTVLPEGTYFFIIDKGDGSKPRTGYLELLR